MPQHRINKFEEKFTKTDGCWIYEGVFGNKGYGGHGGHNAHRVSYRLYRGEIPPGLVIDHLCGNRSCVNPEHLEAVTQRINLLRSPITANYINSAKTHCSRGHLFDKLNTYIKPNGCRNRKECLKLAHTKARVAISLK